MRDINFACSELYLSRNTVKGHLKNIYTKLGIHSKQELIDLVEDTISNCLYSAPVTKL